MSRDGDNMRQSAANWREEAAASARAGRQAEADAHMALAADCDRRAARWDAEDARQAAEDAARAAAKKEASNGAV